MAKETPMMKQYRKIKGEHPEAILFFRMGDFYEMFCDDAVSASEVLDLVLTKKNAGIDGQIPMCGVPYHAAENYIAKLIANGFRVAICEQLEDPKTAKGLVKRDVIRIISPGTVLESSLLSESKGNYLAALFMAEDRWGFSYTDISTGVFKTTEVQINGTDGENIFDEIYRISPSELIIDHDFCGNNSLYQQLKRAYSGLITEAENEDFDREETEKVLCDHFKVENSEELFIPDAARRAAGAILRFLYRTQKRSLDYLVKLDYYKIDRYMVLDQATRKNLELTSTIFTNQKRGSLLWILDKAKGSMGKRLIREWLENPLLDVHEIHKRQSGVKEMYEQPLLMNHIRSILTNIHDLERLISRIAYGNGTPRDVAALRDSLRELPALKQELFKTKSDIFTEIESVFDDLKDVCDAIDEAFVDDPPVTSKEGGIIREGYNKQVDEYRELSGNGHRLILDLEAKEREATGIKNLRIRYNRVFGYFIEVSNSFKDKVPEHYIRKQTLTTGERFYTPELKEYEEKVLNARENLYGLEYDLFCGIRNMITDNTARIQLTASLVAVCDALISFAVVAQENQYCCPVVDESDVIEITGGRHPMVEKVNSEVFVANDTSLNIDDRRIMVITGPNMAGKSTYMRQVALIILLAQIGSFVPADSARIGITDRIFTRIGASDDLVGGNSTFMVEMRETAMILKRATAKSFVILDEIGRGTSTFDGLSLAKACIEYLSDADNAPKTLFATHYHELTALEQEKNNLKNYAIRVDEINGNLVFLRKITPGKADKSYGIQVARLAGMPVSIINNAKKILRSLEKSKLNTDIISYDDQNETTLFKETTPEEEEVLNHIRKLDINVLRPLDALKLLEEWQDYLKHE